MQLGSGDMMDAEHRKEVKTMQFNEHQARMLAEQRQREAEMKQRAYELEMKQGKHGHVPNEDVEYELGTNEVRHYKRPKEQKKEASKENNGRWWRFLIG